ncbi:RHS repeat domain-containing protein [Taibaiella helva]|uniref:RHS repeat domain-containing protein n=1 Tax=Taibaiella helva TaxID=2301235 RepID=UPI000E589029|nr:RHS repeat-associated core domain-containing protein [Taibaiella helva]
MQELVINPGQPTKQTDYIGNFVYQNDTLQYALTDDGRTVFDYSSATPIKEEYFVKDHLGNVRSIIDITLKPLRQYLATYEVASAYLEGMLFEKVSEIRDEKPASTDPGDSKAGRLNAAEAGREVGTSLLVKVMAGDLVDMNVNNYYETFEGNTTDPVTPEQLMASVISTLTSGVNGMPGESHNTKLVSELFTQENFSALENMIQSQGIDPTRPQAYLTYALFDENMKLVDEFSGAYQVNGNGTWGSIGSNGARMIPTNGYLAVYLNSRWRDLSCASCSNVFFDRVVLEIAKGSLLEENHYYPHGLPIKALSSTAQGVKDNRRKYQGNEYIKDLGLNWMDFNARQYDPQIGRFLAVDPLADAEGQQVFSPYAAMGNAPESLVDPNGEEFSLFASHADGWRFLNSLSRIYGVTFDWDETSGKVTIKDDLQKEGQERTSTEMAQGASGAFAQAFGEATKTWFKEMVESKDVKVQAAVANNSALIFSEDYGNFEHATETGHLSVMQDLINGVDLSGIPDFDGRITLEEANNWYREGHGRPLYANLSLLYLKSVTPAEFEKGKKYTYFNLLFRFNRRDGLVYGTIGLKYLGNNEVSAAPDFYDFDIRPWTPQNWVRNAETQIGSWTAGAGRGYPIFFYGKGKISPNIQGPTKAWELGF